MELSFVRNTALLALACSFVSVQQVYAQTATITIDVTKPPYNSVTSGGAHVTTIADEVEVRMAAMYALVGAYNSTHAGAPLMNTTVQFKWRDGSSEKGKVTDSRSTVGVVPIPNTQEPPPNSGGSGGEGGYYDPDDGSGFGNDNPYSNCIATPRTITVTVGNYTETTRITELKCP
jgi:hypothetical protein